MSPAGSKAKKKTFDTDWTEHKATKAALSAFEKSFEKKVGVPLNERLANYEVVSTGSLAFDAALVVGGLATGRIHEMWGPEHAGKTSLAIMQAAQFQKRYPDRRVAWLDMEQTFDEKWATKLGLDVAKMWRPPVKTAEQVADFAQEFMTSGLVSFLVIDSVGSMISVKEYQKEADEDVVAAVAKIVTRMVKKTAPVAASNNTTVMVINQVRSKIGGYGPDQDTSGGWALKHITTSKVQIRRGGDEPKKMKVRGQEVEVGYQIAARVQKLKVGPKGRLAEMWLFNQPTVKYGPVGIDQVDETFEFAKLYGVITGTSWCVLPDGQKFNGKPKTVDYLRTDPEMVASLRKQVLDLVAEDSKSEDAEDVSEVDDEYNMAAVLDE